MALLEALDEAAEDGGPVPRIALPLVAMSAVLAARASTRFRFSLGNQAEVLRHD